MKNKHESIKKIVTQYINKEENGGFWLPNIQRHFVWEENQIEKLFDSLMRKYPIGTLLIWKTKNKIPTRRFIDHFESDLRLKTELGNANVKLLVLDGQQRLQSLFLGIKGTYNGKELFLNMISGDKKHPEEISYEFRFFDANKAELPFVKFSELVLADTDSYDLEQKILNEFDDKSKNLSDDERKRIKKNIARMNEVFKETELILYQELDSIDSPNLYTDDDVVEVFIRANSGGTVLSKSDLLFSLLTAAWPDTEKKMDDLLNGINLNTYKFNRDFILKTCLCLLNKGARYDVEKFRTGSTREEIEISWQNICDAISDVRDFLYNKTYIRSDKSLPSYMLLIPLIYFRYYYPEKWENKQGSKIVDYLLTTLIAGSFSGTPDNLIDHCINDINDKKDFLVEDIFRIISEDKRNLAVTPDHILNECYGGNGLHLLFSIWYKEFNYNPTFDGNEPQVDHIFPQSRLKEIKVINPETGRKEMKYTWEVRDQIANLALLTSKENGFEGKRDILPEVWFKDKPQSYLEMHLIPQNPELWKLENFEKFIEERKKLILQKFNNLLLKEKL